MVVIAIIGILAGVAIPQYAQYTKRAKFAGVIAQTIPYKLAVVMCIEDKDTEQGCDNGEGDIGKEITTAIGHTAKLKVENGTITATGTPDVSNAVYKLVPNFVSTTNSLTWSLDSTVTNACLGSKLCRDPG